jgi:hypothetical protein
VLAGRGAVGGAHRSHVVDGAAGHHGHAIDELQNLVEVFGDGRAAAAFLAKL